MRRWPRSPAEVLLAVEVIATVTRMAWEARRGHVRQLLARNSVVRRAACGQPAAGEQQTLELAAEWADAWLARFPANEHGSCYTRALTLYAIASRHGVPVSFALGVRRDGDRVHAHAWLTRGEASEPYLERSDGWRDYTLCFAYPEAASR